MVHPLFGKEIDVGFECAPFLKIIVFRLPCWGLQIINIARLDHDHGGVR